VSPNFVSPQNLPPRCSQCGSLAPRVSLTYRKWPKLVAESLSSGCHPSLNASVFCVLTRRGKEKRLLNKDKLFIDSPGAFLTIHWQLVNSLVESSKSIRLDNSNFVLVQGQNLKGIETLECAVVDDGDFVVVEIEDEEVMEIFEGTLRDILQLIL
jgi:hypothetical protein